MQTDSVTVLPAVEATRWVAFGCALGLVLLGAAWELWLAPLRPGGSWWALKILPLCAALPGLYLRRMYTYRWTTLLVWLYFTEGVVRASGRGIGDSLPLALLEIVLSVTLFAACTLHVRLRLRSVRP
ncbi:MAG: hypothetical protein JWP65_1757 [Ramlibacter sp.]|jgi:uncharacterized membrane protein|uniref:DUF2069 domain-containing protein n=1 Tax=Ramlibacter sp. TaxID=1917967 RepID=UPI002620C2F4|nr:DUF2069 domain-containing protein [Ramlibacter sp.]MDB5751336.1 hypothetical protein [Ramlibacter sp.]